MSIRAKKIRVEFNNSSEDFWEATCGSGIELDEAMRMITRVWEEHDASAEPLIKDKKIRKALQAWAEACEIESDDAIMVSGLAPAFTRFYTSMYEIDIKTESSLELDEHRDYVIAELCGAPEPLEPTFIDLDERIKEKEEE